MVSKLNNELALPHELENLPRMHGGIPNQLDLDWLACRRPYRCHRSRNPAGSSRVSLHQLHFRV